MSETVIIDMGTTGIVHMSDNSDEVKSVLFNAMSNVPMKMSSTLHIY